MQLQKNCFKEMTELNKKVDVLTDIYSSLIKIVSKLK